MKVIVKRPTVKPSLKRQIKDATHIKKINYKYLDLGYLKYLNSTKSKIEVDE